MGIAETILGIALLVLAAALIVLVLMQQGKDKKLSGAIAGGSDSFYGKSKGAGKDWKPIATTIIAVVFVIVVVAMYLVV